SAPAAPSSRRRIPRRLPGVGRRAASPSQSARATRRPEGAPMVRAVTPPRERAWTSSLVLALALVAGCSTTGVRTDRDLGRPSDGAGSVGDLMSQRDHQALVALAATRAQEGRDGYRIGPDDLLDIRIPKLLSVQPTDSVHAANSGATLPSVAEAP